MASRRLNHVWLHPERFSLNDGCPSTNLQQTPEGGETVKGGGGEGNTHWRKKSICVQEV